MANLDMREEDEEENSNVIQLGTVIPGGKDGDWLKNMPEGTVFLARRKNDKGFIASEFEIEHKIRGHAMLTQHADGESHTYWVINIVFCSALDLLEIIRVPDIKE